MNDVNLIEPAACSARSSVAVTTRPHRRAELPGDDVTREVVQYRAEVEPAPTDHLEIVKSVCQSWFGAVVLSLNSSAAFMTM